MDTPNDVRSHRRLISLADTCRILGNIGRTKAYGLIAAGELQVVKLGRRTLLIEADVYEFIDRLPRSPAPLHARVPPQAQATIHKPPAKSSKIQQLVVPCLTEKSGFG